MALTVEKKSEIVKKFGSSKNDTGKTEVQVALLTERIKYLTDHFKDHSKDNHSRRGLLKLVGQRRRLMKYFKRKDKDAYLKLIGSLSIRDNI
jgi:small subunit ribosomal protein S15